MGVKWKPSKSNAFDRLISDESSGVELVRTKKKRSKSRRRGRRLWKRGHVMARPREGAGNAAWRHFYASYIHSLEWESKRQEAFEFHGRVCNRCGVTRRLQVHHLTYNRIGCELMEDLEILCDKCHSAEHRRRKP